MKSFFNIQKQNLIDKTTNKNQYYYSLGSYIMSHLQRGHHDAM